MSPSPSMFWTRLPLFTDVNISPIYLDNLNDTQVICTSTYTRDSRIKIISRLLNFILTFTLLSDMIDYLGMLNTAIFLQR